MKGSVWQRSKGSWQLKFDGPRDASGRRKQITETVRGTKKDAERVLRERIIALESGSYIHKQKETVAEFMQRWLETYAATNTTRRTQLGYRGNINRYVNPAIGTVVLQNLTARHIQAMYARLLERGLNARTVLHTHRVLKEALGHAVRWGLLSRNVAEAVTPPRHQPKEMHMWDVDTINRFLEISQGHRFHDFYHLAVLTGMRRSELAGLKWKNVDLVLGRLGVVSTRQRIIGEGIIEGLPKTARSRRLIALSPTAVGLLHEIRGKQIEQQLALGEIWQNTGYVFTQADGHPVNPDSATQEFAKLVKKFGLPHLTLHGLRHAHATLLLTANVNPKVVSERLGHSNIAITMDTYSHVIPGLQEAAALALDQQLSRRRNAAPG